jgi:hypothetical protein
MQIALPSVAIAALLTLSSCTKNPEPEKESKIGLEQAMKGVEQAEERFKRMRENGEVLQQKIDEQTKLLDSTIAKHLGLLASRVDAEEKSVLGFPAEKQTALLPLVADRKQQITVAEAAFRDYRDAPPRKVEELKAKLQSFLEKLNSTFAQLAVKAREAEAK